MIDLLMVVTEDWYFRSHRLLLARRAAASGFRVSVATRINDPRSLRGEPLRIHPLDWKRTGGPLAVEVATVRELRRIVRETRPRLIHAVALKPIIYVRLALLGMREPPTLCAVSGLGITFAPGAEETPKRRLIREALRFGLDAPARWTLVQNEADGAAVRGLGLPTARVRNIPGVGVDLGSFKGVEAEKREPLVLFAARLLRSKGVFEFVEVARRLRDRFSNWRFLLVGGPDSGSRDSLSDEELRLLRDEGAVELLGHRDDLHELMGRASLFVFPTRYGEGVPKVLLEAAACGLPVVASDLPGCRHAVRAPETGRLVEAGDVEKLTHEVATLLAENDTRQRMGEAARALAEAEFDEVASSEATLALYREMVA